MKTHTIAAMLYLIGCVAIAQPSTPMEVEQRLEDECAVQSLLANHLLGRPVERVEAWCDPSKPGTAQAIALFVDHSGLGFQLHRGKDGAWKIQEKARINSREASLRISNLIVFRAISRFASSSTR